ncbi:MAG TPA: PIN domain-containing protein [Solirubrobacterales bacterium]|nr:PIN domain-containing protein [Solirubrobacterales bacterium]
MLLLDNSAWSRLLAGRLPGERAEQVARWMEERRLGTCLPFLLEAGYSARSAADRQEMMVRLEQLPRVQVDEEVERVALETQRELAQIGHHRLPPTDLVIAACAHKIGGGIVHCDRDYDRIVQHTRLSFESVWVGET